MTRRRWALAALSVALVFWSLGGEWVSIHRGIQENHFIDALGGLSYLFAGVVAVDRRPGNIIGRLMIGYGFIWFLGNWGNLQVPLLPVLGVVGGQLLGPPFLAHIALAYPTGRLRARFDRIVLGLTYAVAVGTSVVVLLTYSPRTGGCIGCAWEPALIPSSTAAPINTAIAVSQRSALVLVPMFLAAVWLRWRRATPAERRDLTPLWIAVCVLALMYLLSAFGSPYRSDQFSYLMWELQTLANLSVPLLFGWGLLSTRLARSAVGDLVLELDRPLRAGDLQSSLSRTLGDPDLELLYALDGQDRWVNGSGQPRLLPDGDAGTGARTFTLVERERRPLAALVHDPSLDPGLVRAAAAAAGIAIENERLHAEVRAQLEEVRASRQRIVEAGDRERRRVERNLHDGAQQRLATLALSLAMLRDRKDADPAWAASVAQAHIELKQAIGELRELARGIHPAIVTEEGLPAAVESLADRSSVPVVVAADFDARLPEPVETVAYFVVSEALANVAKYAHASRATVELSRWNGTLRVEVADDGVGGADAACGSGLRGLADRVAAVRGSFSVLSPSTGGTRLRAEIPCDG